MATLYRPEGLGVVQPGPGAKAAPIGAGLAEVAPGLVVPTEHFLCQAHGRQFRRAGIPAGDIHRALIDALLDNPRFQRRCGESAASAAVTLQLRATRPWCCYLAAPERKRAMALAASADLETTLVERMSARRERAATSARRRVAKVLASSLNVSLVDASYAVHAFSGDADMAKAAIEAAQRDSAPVRDVVDAIRARL